MKHTRVVSTKCTPGFACRAFSDTTLVCFIVNEHTTKCSRYRNNCVYPQQPHEKALRTNILLYDFVSTTVTRNYGKYIWLLQTLLLTMVLENSLGIMSGFYQYSYKSKNIALMPAAYLQ